MRGPYFRQWVLPPAGSVSADLFSDLEKVLRLGPQWNVQSLRSKGPLAESGEFELYVEHDRTEIPLSFSVRVEAFDPGKVLRLVMVSPSHALDFLMEVTENPDGRRVSFSIGSVPPPAGEDLREYDLWARSIVNYIKISESRSPLTRIWKWFLDRWWLKMPQSGKRIVFFVVVSEGFSFLFLIAILLWWKFSSAP